MNIEKNIKNSNKIEKLIKILVSYILILSYLRTLIIQYFDFKYYIQIELNNSGYKIDSIISQ